MNSAKTKRDISRRKFINLGAQGYAALGLSSTFALPLVTSGGCTSQKPVITHGACYHDCPDACSWTVTTDRGKIAKFEASSSNPFTAGKLCSKMDDFPNSVTFHPDRILTPMKRVGKKGEGKFESISWELAIREVAEKLKKVIAEKGQEAVLPYSFAGTEGLIQKGALPDRFFAHIGATKLDRTICGDAAVTGVMCSNGQSTGILPEDIVHSRYIILWGTNPVVSNQHLWPLILKARKSGARIVVIDPFQSQSAIQADWHIQPIPGTDTVLALGMIHVILSENLQDQGYIDKYTQGIQELTSHVEKYNPVKVAQITGLEQSVIVDLAREYAAASPSVIRLLIGMEHQANGASAFRAVSMLPAITGAWKNQGGGLCHMTYELFGQALNWERVEFAKTLEKSEIRSVNMVQIGKALMDTSLAPGIHALFVYNSNPAVIAPNQNLVIKGLEREDLMTVVIEHFITDTARYADYVFPATTQLEHWDLMDSWGQTSLNLNQPAIAPIGQSKPNSEFFRLLSKELGFTEDYLFESDLDIIKETLKSDHEYMKGITFESLQKTGWAELNIPKPWIPHAEGNFGTSSGKCEFFNGSINPPLPEYHPVLYSDEELSKYPLKLLTIKSTKNFLNSSHANVDQLRKNEGRPFMDMHQSDADERSIVDGDEVKAFNQNGRVLITVRISEKVRKGVVCMPQGFWPSLMNGNSSANALTKELLTDMGNGAALQEARVEIVKT
jgi:anaerobic selenocysteine-containing dehydrogenase